MKKLITLLIFIFYAILVNGQATGIFPRTTAVGTNTYIAPAPAGCTCASYVDGGRYQVLFTNGNTLTTVTLAIHTAGAKTVYNSSGQALVVGEIGNTDEKILIYSSSLNGFRIVGGVNLDSDLITISNLSPTNDDIIQRKAGAWVNRSISQLKTDLAINNIDNTSDANKPVSTAQQTALDLKANLTSPSLIGTPTAPTAAGSTNTTQVATTAFVKTYSPKYFGVACSDLTTAFTTGTNKGFLPVPIGFTVTGVYAEVLTAQTSGSILTIDILENGISILSTKITIDNNETSSRDALTAPVISDSSIAAFARLTVSFTQVGTGGAGAVVWIYGY